ncbi:MAG: hypothetical protein HC845_01330 [Akkermansiaceae bacterium]|nr:hypothetical protein [Akkermansiaceae bacterium]
MIDWILNHLQFVILGVFVFASVLKSIFGPKTEEADPHEENWPKDVLTPRTQRRAPTVPPPLITPPALPRQLPAQIRETGYEAAAAEEAAQALKHQQDLADRLRKIRETKATTSGGASATRARINAQKSTKPIAPSAVTIRSRLRNPSEIRQAYIMREILDPPVALR